MCCSTVHLHYKFMVIVKKWSTYVWSHCHIIWWQLTISIFCQADARRSVQLSKRPRHPRSSVIKTTKKLKLRKNLGIETYSPSSPFSLPPFESLGPMPMPENAPPYCLYPPTTTTPLPPSTAIPPPLGYTPSSPIYLPPVLPIQSPPPSPTITIPGPPTILPGPPEAEPSPFIYIPSPPGSTLSPPYYEPSPPSYVSPSPPSYVPSPTGFVPSPPSYVPSPPSSYVPSPTGFVPSPPVFEPPVVFPPPTVPPPPNTAPNIALWCVAKPSVPDPIIQEAMDYACWSGADCSSILPDGSCFQPNTLFAHASFAFNSYWQRTRVAGGTCEFGGTAILVTVDPSEFTSKHMIKHDKPPFLRKRHWFTWGAHFILLVDRYSF